MTLFKAEYNVFHCCSTAVSNCRLNEETQVKLHTDSRENLFYKKIKVKQEKNKCVIYLSSEM